MTDMALGSVSTPARKTPGKLGDALFAAGAAFCGFLVLILLFSVMVSMTVGAWPALEKFGLGFLWSDAWSSRDDTYGALPAIYGTLVTSAIAMVIAVPVSFGIAIFLTELCPHALRRPIGIAVELLAAIPSIIFGIWGFFVLAPWLARHVYPHGNGSSLLTAGIILGTMVLPFLVAVMRDVFETAPAQMREAAFGLGATTWEVMWSVILPYSRVGVVGGFMLALGRALGETMAVTFVIGNAKHINLSLFDPGTTISASLASDFAEADGMKLASLLAMGFVLFVLTFGVIGAARLMLARLSTKYGG